MTTHRSFLIVSSSIIITSAVKTSLSVDMIAL